MTKEEYKEYCLYTNKCANCGRIFLTEDLNQAYCEHCDRCNEEDFEDEESDIATM